MLNWKDSECEIHIIKKRGYETTIQKYDGNNAEILTCISSMIEQLIRHRIITLDQLHLAVKMPLEKLKNELNNKEE